MQLRIAGQVQGVGFRPFVYRLARELGLTGWVNNDAARRDHRGPGPAGGVRGVRPPPARASCRRWRRSPAATSRASPGRAGDGAVRDPPLRGRRAGRRPGHRRHRRLRRLPARDERPRRPALRATRSSTAPTAGRGTRIVRRIPYDRPNTTMADFAMCPLCARRVRRPGQPAVPRPADRLPDVRARASGWSTRTAGRSPCDDPIAEAARAAGRRARSSPSRAWAASTWPAGPTTTTPSAACAGASTATPSRSPSWCADLDQRAAALPVSTPRPPSCCAGRMRPIVLLPACASRRRSRRPSAQGLATLGVMLPYTPLHHLLFASRRHARPAAGDDQRQLHRRAAGEGQRRRRRPPGRTSPTRCCCTTAASSAAWTTAWCRCTTTAGRRVLRRARGYAPAAGDVLTQRRLARRRRPSWPSGPN